MHVIHSLTSVVKARFRIEGIVFDMINSLGSGPVVTLSDIAQRVYFDMLARLRIYKVLETEEGRAHTIAQLHALDEEPAFCKDAALVRAVVAEELIHQATHDFVVRADCTSTIVFHDGGHSYSPSLAARFTARLVPQWPLGYVIFKLPPGIVLKMQIYGLIEGEERQL